MEIGTMNYYFTAILIVLICLLTLIEPAYPRNDYLNNGTNSCSYGSVDLSIGKGTRDSNSNNSNPYWDKREEDNNDIRLSFRKNLGISKKDCDRRNKIATENEILKQQLELYKKCGSVNNNPTIEYNENFKELVAYCKNIKTGNELRPKENLWKKLKKDYLEENKDIKIYDKKN
jgi:hypothetical protein